MNIERDILGFVEERCPYCNARLYVSDLDAERGHYRAICLNACALRAWEYRKMQQGLAQAKRSVDAEGERAEKT